MAFRPDPNFAPSDEGSRIIVAIIGLSLISVGMFAGALAVWGVL